MVLIDIVFGDYDYTDGIRLNNFGLIIQHLLIFSYKFKW